MTTKATSRAVSSRVGRRGAVADAVAAQAQMRGAGNGIPAALLAPARRRLGLRRRARTSVPSPGRTTTAPPARSAHGHLARDRQHAGALGGDSPPAIRWSGPRPRRCGCRSRPAPPATNLPIRRAIPCSRPSTDRRAARSRRRQKLRTASSVPGPIAICSPSSQTIRARHSAPVRRMSSTNTSSPAARATSRGAADGASAADGLPGPARCPRRAPTRPRERRHHGGTAKTDKGDAPPAASLRASALGRSGVDRCHSAMPEPDEATRAAAGGCPRRQATAARRQRRCWAGSGSLST